jgi:hypothetical protein
MEDEGLAQRVQNLPRELYNLILAKVFTPGTNVHEINENYKPPKFLAVSRITRDMHAKAYYVGLDSSFVFDGLQGKPIVPLV